MISILWVDDEIELLKSHIIYLESKGYSVTPVNSGNDAIEILESSKFDLVFLDENMPGLSGLETLNLIKKSHPNLPIVMITKNEEESIMEEAIGSKISDYLIKPVNPNQILLTIKKNLEFSKLINNKTNADYQREFSAIGSMINDVNTFNDWVNIYKKIIYW